MKTKYNASFYRGLGGRGKYSSPPLLSPPFLPDSGRIRGVVTRQRDRPVVLIYLVLKLGGLLREEVFFQRGHIEGGLPTVYQHQTLGLTVPRERRFLTRGTTI